jgi:acetyl esterase/lipase
VDRRTLMTGAVASAAALTMFSPAQAFAAEDDAYLRFVHPELRNIAGKIMAGFKDRPPLSAITLAAQRAEMAQWARPQRSDVPVERKLIAGTGRSPAVAIYVINAKPGEARPAILHTHGGGYVLGTAQGAVTDLQDLCAELGCMAISVDYRLAPETTYAGSIEDNYAGLKWLYDNAASIGADPARIAVMGESAGGGHAAILAQVARDRGQVPVAFQCLVYPMLDDRTGSSVPASAQVGRIIWTPEANRFGWRSFLGREPGGPTAPKYAVPARTANLAGLPPAWIGVGGIDLFADEDIAYARRLNAAGVPVELIVVPGAFHGFDGVGAMDPSVRVSGWFNTAKKNALRRGLGLPVV